MPISVQCPECAAKLTAPDAAAGKKVKCPKCGAPIAVAAPAPAAEFEVVDEPEATEPPAEEPAKKPKKKVSQAEAEEEGERPRHDKKRKSRNEDEEEDERPRKKRTKEQTGSKKPLIFALAGVGVLLLVGVGAAVWFATRPKAPDAAKAGPDGTPNPDGTPTVADDLKVISPRATLTTTFPGKESSDREMDHLALSSDGGVLVARNRYSSVQSQVWSVRGEPKKLDAYDGEIVSISSDGTLMSRVKKTETVKPVVTEIATGTPSDRPFTSMSKIHLQTATARYSWNTGFDERKQNPLRIFHTELPSGKSLGPLDGGDEDRVEHAPPVKNGTEIVFSLPRTNKVRVFNFAAKAVTREFELANPRNSKGSITGGGWTSWSCYRVSPDGKWIAIKRWTGAAGPDPFDIYDMTGAVVATLPRSAVADHMGTFLINRDVYVGLFDGAKGMNLTRSDLPAYDINKKQFVAAFRSTHKAYVSQVALSADGKVMATGDNVGRVCIWDLTQLP